MINVDNSFVVWIATTSQVMQSFFVTFGREKGADYFVPDDLNQTRFVTINGLPTTICLDST